MKVRRDVKSIPVRSAAETWTAFVELVTGPGTKYREELDAVGGIINSLIVDEHPAKAPFIMSGVGPRLVVYCSFASDAMTGDENLDDLSWNPTAGEWQLLVPCDEENLSWVRSALAKKSARVHAYDVDSPEEIDDAQESAEDAGLEIDWTAGGAL
jgi:hypothetical protein